MQPNIALIIILTFEYILFKNNVENVINNMPLKTKIAVVIALAWVIISMMIELSIPYL